MIPIVLAAATAVIGVIGWLWWRGDGELKRGSGEQIRPDEVALTADAFGSAATLLLFGSRQDERTPVVLARLEALIEGRDDVRIAEVDLTSRGDLAGRYAVTRTPSVFVLDGDDRLCARVKGAGSEETLRDALALALPRVV